MRTKTRPNGSAGRYIKKTLKLNSEAGETGISHAKMQIQTNTSFRGDSTTIDVDKPADDGLNLVVFQCRVPP